MGPDFTSFILSIILGCVVLDGGGWFVHVNATTCTATTGNFCPTTLFSTGVCGADGNCECVAGHSPAQWGCQKDLEVPVIELLDKDALPYGSEGANFTLVCTPSDITFSYVWRYQGNVVDGETGSTLFVAPNITDSPHGYTCQYTDNTETSIESDNFEINIILLSSVGLNSATPDIASHIVGFPTTLVNETLVILTCTPFMKVNATFSWSSSLTSEVISDNVLEGEVNTANANSSVTCTVTYDDGSDTLQVVTSTVIVPMISDNIPGVHIAEGDRFVRGGGSMTLTCAFDEDDFLSDGLSITWEWFVNNTQAMLSGQSITVNLVDAGLHQGEWKCAATYEDQPRRESPVIFVYVDFPLTASVTTRPPTPIRNGFLEIRCDVDSSLMAVDVTYGWQKDTLTLTNYVDNTLFINEVNSTHVDIFVCTAIIDQLEQNSTIRLDEPVTISDSPAPILMFNDTIDTFVFAELYELTCEIDSDYATPGVEIIFYDNGIAISTGEDDIMFVTGNVTDRNFTCAAAFDSISTTESNSIFVSFEVFDFVQVENTSEIVTTAIDGIVNTEVTLLCEVGLLPDVPAVISYTWFAEDVQVGDEEILDYVLTQEGDVIVYCVADLGSHSLRSSNNVTVTGHVFEAPVLSLINGNSNDILNFSQAYYLRCQADPLFAALDLNFDILQDGRIIHSEFNDTFKIPNDVQDREYTCEVVLLSEVSPVSNSINITFKVFDSVEIQDMDQNVITSIDSVLNMVVILECQVTLALGVSEEATVTWFDEDSMQVGDEATLQLNVTEEGGVTYFCLAELGSHSLRSANNVTVTGRALVFDSLEIQNIDGDLLTSVNAIANTSISLVSSVSLFPGVSGDASITWYDQDLTDLGTNDILVVNVTEGLNPTYFFEAELGRHTMRSNNVTITGGVFEAPVLSVMDSVSAENLNFSRTYFLHCDTGTDFSSIALQYEYSRDGIVVETSTSTTYEIENDVMVRKYTCRVSYQTATSPISNSVNTSFEVFEEVHIVESLRCHVRSSIDPTFLSTLTCNVTLLPGIPNQINYTWQDANNTGVSSASTYAILVTDDLNTTITCQAEVGSHIETVTMIHDITVNDVMVPCSASSLHLSLTLLVLAFVLAYCHFVH